MAHSYKEDETSRKDGPSDLRSNPFWDFWAPVLFTLGLYLGIRCFVAEARYIPSGSMLPGLQIQDRLFVEKLSLRNRSPRVGEIVVFNSPHAFDPVLSESNRPSQLRCTLVNMPFLTYVPFVRHPACDAYIKRVVAVEGDRFFINDRGQIILNGEKTYEPYISNYCDRNKFQTTTCRTLKGKVPPGHVLVLGDNRVNSWDGRYWPGTPFLPESEILGRAFWRFWPLNRVGSLIF